MESGYSVLGIEHVHITTPAELEEDVKEWYRSCLGLEEIEKPEGMRVGGSWFRAGAHELHISIDEHNPPKDAHFGLVVDNLEPVVDCLREHGCHVEQAPSVPGRHTFYTRDPAGNRIEVIHFDEPMVVAVEESLTERRARVLHEEK